MAEAGPTPPLFLNFRNVRQLHTLDRSGAHQVIIRYQVQGLVIDNYRTDLPVKKGLSSSAAVCVLLTKKNLRVNVPRV